MKNLIKKNYGKATILVLLLAVIAIIIKIIVLKYQPNFVIIPNGLRIITAENMGNTWGMGESNLLNVIISNVIVLGIILKFIQFQKDRIDTKTLISLSFILAGGMSNLFERLVCGTVTDYIQFFPQYNFPVFNLADIYILCGWVMFAAILAYITGRKRTRKERRQELLAEINEKMEQDKKE